MSFTAYGSKIKHTQVINVAGGGVSDKVDSINIEIEYKDAEMNEVEAVYYAVYARYGLNPTREKIGVDIRWEEDDRFVVLDEDGKKTKALGDDSSDEEEEEEEKDEVLDYFKSLEQAGKAKMVSFEEFQKGHNGPKGP
jgi:hypothetical protein